MIATSIELAMLASHARLGDIRWIAGANGKAKRH